uniref:Uncharacterized protein n=1 Tax=Timema tahoe TaxID=61484 RepID=A0A7R9P1X8_9NEOP|nr:unnamed protein product [Timema tahoe]
MLELLAEQGELRHRTWTQISRSKGSNYSQALLPSVEGEMFWRDKMTCPCPSNTAEEGELLLFIFEAVQSEEGMTKKCIF